jgi:hypothetical protein
MSLHKVRIPLRLRNDFADLPSVATGQRKGGRTENKEEAVHGDSMSERSQGLEVVESSKMTERSGNICENKGSTLRRRERSRYVAEKEVLTH